MNKAIKKLITITMVLSISLVSLGFSPLNEKPPPVPQSDTTNI